MAREFLGIAYGAESEAAKLATVKEALDRAGLTAKQAVLGKQLLNGMNVDEPPHLSPAFGALLTFLLERTDFGTNVHPR